MSTSNSVKDELKYYKDIVNKEINKYIENIDAPELLKECMLYSINAGGKGLRPALLLSVYESLKNKDIKEALPFACAIEMIHTYSLIHDDLPSMDNDTYRRGKYTCHVVYGEDMAILAGDALLNTAFEIIADNTSSLAHIKACRELIKSSGASGMIGGQVRDIKGVDNEEDLLKMYSMKTGQLIKAPVIAGAYLANCNEDIIKYLKEYAMHLGIAFQIRDDILDVIGDFNNIGKTAGSDEKNNKNTFVTMYGLDKSKSMLDEHTNKALQLLKKIDIDFKFLNDITIYLNEREN